MQKKNLQGHTKGTGPGAEGKQRRPLTGTPFPAKVTPPKTVDVMPRPRLYEQLDKAAQKRITWIVAPAGAGKTTMVADYLQQRGVVAVWYSCDEGDADPSTFFYYMCEAARRVLGGRAASLPLLHPEHVTDVELFSRRFFENLSRQLAATGASAHPVALVLDNFQQVPLSEAMLGILAAVPDGLCEGVRAIVISREEAPSVLVRVQAGEQMAQMDFNDLRFTVEETQQLVQRRQPHVAQDAMLRMHELTQGWVAGLTLMLAGQRHREMSANALAEAGADVVMSYFAEEIFAHFDREQQQFLLETAVLPTVNVAQASQLTGNNAAQQILANLCRGHLFTKCLDSEGLEYQYHPLLKEFLLAKAEALFSPEQMDAVRTRAARLMEQTLQVEDAARLYAEAGNSMELARMIKTHARDLLELGRSHTLEGWLVALSGEPTKDPWILYWHAICAFTKDLSKARTYLQVALESFLACKDRRGIYLAWSGLVDAYSLGFDDWRPLEDCIALFENLQADDPSFPDRATELIVVSHLLSALTVARMDRPEQVEHWIDRMNTLLDAQVPVDVRINAVLSMSVYYLWRGAYEKNAVLLERAHAEIHLHSLPPFIALRVQLMVAVQAWITAQYDAAHRAVADGLALAEESGLHGFDSLLWSFKVAAHLAQGELEDGENALTRQLAALLGPERTLDIYFYHINAAWHALLVGKPALACEYLKAISRKVERIGNHYFLALWHLGLAQAVFLLDRPQEAMEHARVAGDLAVAMDSWVMQWYALSVEAWLLLRQNRRPEGLQALQRALVLGRRHGYIHLELFLPDGMRFLLTTALEEKIEPEFVRGVIRKIKLDPPLASLDAHDRALAVASLAHWPFRVRVYTMGRFEIQIQDQPLSFSGKEKKRPLEMLKALIALGGVDVSEEALADQLWPEADGDLAHKSLETTLSRLRRLLGSEASILYRGRRITLNPADCWVDCLALEQMLEQLDTATEEPAASQASHVLALMQGRFLNGDRSLECFSDYRERLREKQLHLLLKLGLAAEGASEWGQAADYYQRAISIDSLNEESYLRLMLCQNQMGNRSGAVRTYLRCEQHLRAGLAIEPSPETQALYRSIAGDGRGTRCTHANHAVFSANKMH